MAIDLLNAQIAQLDQRAIGIFLGKAKTALQEEYQELEAALVQGDWLAIKPKAHKFKGTLSLLGCKDVLKLLGQLQEGTPVPGSFRQALLEEYTVCLARVEAAQAQLVR